MKNNVFLTILIVILLAVVLKFTVFGTYSEKTTINLLNKSKNYNNFTANLNYINYENSENSMEAVYKQKDNKIFYTANINGMDTAIYIDKDTDEVILTFLNYAMISKFSEMIDDEYSVESANEAMNILVEKLESKEYEYKFIENTKLNDTSCIHISITQKSGVTSSFEDSYYKEEYYIDKKLGTIVKEQAYDSDDKLIEEIEMFTTINNVDDIKRPNLSNKEVIRN